jgi:hypothetical protein
MGRGKGRRNGEVGKGRVKEGKEERKERAGEG